MSAVLVPTQSKEPYKQRGTHAHTRVHTHTHTHTHTHARTHTRKHVRKRQKNTADGSIKQKKDRRCGQGARGIEPDVVLVHLVVESQNGEGLGHALCKSPVPVGGLQDAQEGLDPMCVPYRILAGIMVRHPPQQPHCLLPQNLHRENRLF
jgi:hypothetical protein